MKNYDIFISYRREGGKDPAHNLYDRLKWRGYSAFQDVESLRQGKFNEALYDVIDQCKDFILVLPKNALDRCVNEDDWVRLEIARAIRGGKNIIPVFLPEFEFPNKEIIPNDIAEIVDYNGVFANNEYFDAFIEKIESFLVSKPKKRKFVAIGLLSFITVPAIILGILFATSRIPINNMHTSYTSTSLNSDFNSHLILELENANHQYEVGLENWKRLDYNRAERDITAALNDIKNSVSESSADVAKINNTLGCLYIDMGKYKEAYDYLNSAKVVFNELYGMDSVESKATQFSIAEYDYYTGDIDTAKKTLQNIIDTCSEKDEKTVLTVANNFKAMIESSLGNYEKALQTYNNVLLLYKEYLEDGDLHMLLTDYTKDSALSATEKESYTYTVETIAATYSNLGNTYILMNDAEKAEQYIQKGLDLCLNNIYIGTKNLITADLYLNNSKALSLSKQFESAIENVDLAMRIEKNLFDFEGVYPGLVDVYNIYGDLMLVNQNTEKSLEYFNDALSLAKKSFGENHPKTAETYYSIGKYYLTTASYDKAINNIEKAIEIRKNILSYNHPETIEYYLALAEAYSKNAQSNEQSLAIDEAVKIAEKTGYQAMIESSAFSENQ